MNIRNAIKQLALSGTEMYLTVCTVDSVDEEKRTIECTPINEGAPLISVNLQADQSQTLGVVSFPAVGSDVLVGFINPAVAVVLLATEITKTILTIGGTELTVQDGKLKFDVSGTTLEMDGYKSVWNGGSETTANATELKKQLTTMSARIDGIINAITSSAVAPQDGGATYKSNMSAIVSALQKEDFSNMIDDKIKH